MPTPPPIPTRAPITVPPLPPFTQTFTNPPPHYAIPKSQTIPQPQPPPQTRTQAPFYQDTKTQAPLYRNDTIKVVPSEPDRLQEPATVTARVSLPRATASTIVGSRVHVFGDDPDFDRRRTVAPPRPPTVAPIREAEEKEMSYSSRSRSDLSGLAPMPPDIEVVEPIPEKKPSRWKRLFGIGRSKKPKDANVVVKGNRKLEKRSRKKSLVDWDR